MTIGVVHAPNGAADLRDLMRASKTINENLHLVFTKNVAESNARLVAAASRMFDITVLDAHNPTEIEQVSRLFKGVVTFTDDQLELADHLAKVGRLPSAIKRGSWSKSSQRAVASSIIPTSASIDFTRLNTVAELFRGVSDFGLPLVLKPERGSSSRDVQFLRSTEDVRNAGGTLDLRSENPFVLERMVRGRAPRPWLAAYISIEMLSGPARHTHVLTVDKLPLAVLSNKGGGQTVLETGDVIPTVVPHDVHAAILSHLVSMLNAMGVRNRLTHSEYMITADGFVLLEINGRLGGEISALSLRSGGPDLVGLALRACAAQVVIPPITASVNGFHVVVYPPAPVHELDQMPTREEFLGIGSNPIFVPTRVDLAVRRAGSLFNLTFAVDDDVSLRLELSKVLRVARACIGDSDADLTSWYDQELVNLLAP